MAGSIPTYRQFILWLLQFLLIGQGAAQLSQLQFDVFENSKPENLEHLNTSNFEFAPAFYGNGLVFLSSRIPLPGELMDANTKTGFFNLWYYDFLSPSGGPKKFLLPGENNYHFGPCSFSFNQDTIFYSINHTKNKSERNKYEMEIVQASLDNGQWRFTADLPFNNPAYSILHPTLSKNGKLIIFASNKPGGFGKLDLYASRKSGSHWSDPENLGPLINTEENDIFPFLFSNNWLFYSSDGKEGYGGLDIYATQLVDSIWTFPENLGQPVNSKYDDMGLILNSMGNTAYFSSNRKGGKGKDDIYKMSLAKQVFIEVTPTPGIELHKKETVGSKLQLQILDKTDKTPVSEVQIQYIPIDVYEKEKETAGYQVDILQENTRTGEFTLAMKPRLDNLEGTRELITDTSGMAKLIIPSNEIFIVRMKKEGYFEEYTILDASILIPEIYILLEKKTTLTPYVNLSMGSIVPIIGIKYGPDKSNLLPVSFKSIDILIDALKNNPQMNIRLRVHTDALGNSSENRILSQKRAEILKDYIVKSGISNDRIEPMGIGDSEPLNTCNSSSPCSESQHAINRRIEIEIINK